MPEFFPSSPPAPATIQVARLIGGLKVEIDAIAALSESPITA